MRPAAALASLVSLALLPACTSVRPMDDAEAAVRRAYPTARLDPEVRLSVGPMTRALVLGMLAGADDRRDPDTQLAREAVRAARTVSVRTYELAGLDSATLAERPFRYAPRGWAPVVRVRSEGERVWVLTREDRRGTGQLLVGVLSPDELVLVQVTGDAARLRRLVERAQEDEARRAARDSAQAASAAPAALGR